VTDFGIEPIKAVSQDLANYSSTNLVHRFCVLAPLRGISVPSSVLREYPDRQEPVPTANPIDFPSVLH